MTTASLLDHLAFKGLSTLLTRTGLIVGKLVDKQPFPWTARSNGAFLDTQLFFEGLVEAVGAGGVAADSSGAHDGNVVMRCDEMVSEISVVGVVDQSVVKRSAMVGVSVLVLTLVEEGEKHFPLLLLC